MPISAHFTVDGVANPGEHIVAYGATVTLALTSITAADVISWQVLVASEPAYTIPTITPGGTPPGSTASFTFPADPGDDVGRSFRVRAVVSNGQETDFEDALIGAANINGIVPLCPGEQFERHATHGWGPVINALLAGGAGTPVSLGGDVVGTTAANTVVKVNGASVTTAGAAAVGDVLQLTAPNTLGYAKVAAASLAAGAAILGQALIFNGTAWAAGNDFAARNLATTGTLAAGATTVTGSLTAGVNTAKAVLNSYSATPTTHGALWLGAIVASSTNQALAGDGTSTSINGITRVQVAASSVVKAVFTASGLRIGDATDPTTTLDVLGRATIGVSTAKVILDSHPDAPTSNASVWLAQASPSGTNYVLNGNASTTILNAPTQVRFAVAAAAVGNFTATGLRVGDATTATATLDVVGSAKVGASYQATIASLPGATTTHAGMFFATPSATNYAFLGNAADSWVNAPTGKLYLQIGAAATANLTSTGLRIGDNTTATEKLDVVGRAVIGVGAGKATLDSLAGSTATHGALWLGVAAASGTNYTIFGNGSTDLRLNAPASGMGFDFTAGNSQLLARLTATGLRVGDITSATEKLDVVGRAKIGVGAGKCVIDSDISFPASDAVIWLGPITPSATNGALRGDGTTYTMLNGASNLRFRTANTGRGYWDATGLKIGAESAATECLEVVGRAKIGVDTAKVFIDSLIGAPASWGGIWMGLTPSGSNYMLASNGSETRLNAPSTLVRIGVGLNFKVICNSVGTQVALNGSGAVTDQLEVVGTASASVDVIANSLANGKARLAGLVGSTTTHGALYLGNITPSATNATLFGNGTTDTRLSVPGAGAIDIYRNNAGIARFTDTGLKIGAASNAAAALDVGTSGQVLAGFVTCGATPAASGALRLTNNTGLYARNQANSADVRIVDLDTNNKTNVGSATTKQSFSGAHEVVVRNVTASFTVDTTTMDQTICVGTGLGNVTVTLPTPTVGRRITIKRTSGTNDVIVDPGANLIDGSAFNRNLVTDPIDGEIEPYLALEAATVSYWAIVAHWSVLMGE